jgi:hypothetical protein
VKNRYLNGAVHVQYMQGVSGVLGQNQEGGCEEPSCVLSGFQELMHSKYSDIILLCGVIVAFGMLLAVSASG